LQAAAIIAARLIGFLSNPLSPDRITRIPVTSKWVKNSNIGLFEYSDVSSADADKSTQEKGEKEEGEGGEAKEAGGAE